MRPRKSNSTSPSTASRQRLRSHPLNADADHANVIDIENAPSGSSTSVPSLVTDSGLQKSVRKVLDESRRFVDVVLLSPRKIQFPKKHPLGLAINDLMQLDPGAYEIGTVGGRLALGVLIKYHFGSLQDRQALFMLLDDLATWLRKKYLATEEETRQAMIPSKKTAPVSSSKAEPVGATGVDWRARRAPVAPLGTRVNARSYGGPRVVV
jgi:hypothetical protein